MRTLVVRVLVALFFLEAFLSSPTWALYEELPERECPGHSLFWHDRFCWLNQNGGCSPRRSDVHSNHVVRGSAPRIDEIRGTTGVHCLASQGITLIIDLRGRGEGRSREEEAQARSFGIEYVKIPMNTGYTARQVRENLTAVHYGLQYLTDHLQRNPQGNVYVHCAHGEDRTGLFIGAYRLLVENVQSSKARAEMRDHFFGPYPALMGAWIRLSAPRAPVHFDPSVMWAAWRSLITY